MSDASAAPRAPMSIGQQADFLEYLIGRTTTLHRTVAAETILSLTADEVADLEALAARLRRLAPHEADIRRMVTGR
ncbi:hypothetical protein AB7M49_006968 [Bradyrhizobium elkanii]